MTNRTYTQAKGLLVSFLGWVIVFLVYPSIARAQGIIPCNAIPANDAPSLRGILCLALNASTVAIWIGGGVAAIAIALHGMKLYMAKSDPKALAQAQQGLTMSVAGLLLVLFAVTIVRLLQRVVLGLDMVPGFFLPNFGDH